jgi:hypothetical protein
MLLSIAAQQKEQLRLEGIALSICIEIREKRILLKLLKQQAGLKGWLEETSKRGFPHADRSLNYDKKPTVHQSYPILVIT